MPSQRRAQGRRPRRELVRDLRRRFSEHELPIYASAIAFRGLIAVIPLALLGLGLLGALGLQDTWHNSIAPAIEPKVLPAVYRAINASVEKIFSSSSAGLIVFAAALTIWDLSLGMSAVMRVLNRIHDVEEKRSTLRRVVVAVGLAVGVGACAILAVLLMVVAPRAHGSLHVLFGILRWLLAPLLLGLAIGLVVRFAPAQKPDARWASAASLLVIVVDRRDAALQAVGRLRRGFQERDRDAHRLALADDVLLRLVGDLHRRCRARRAAPQGNARPWARAARSRHRRRAAVT